MSYRQHERLVAPARPSRALWRLICGCIAVAVLFMLLSGVYTSLEAALLPSDMRARLRGDLASGASPVAALINLYFFLIMAFALAISLRMFHDRGLFSLLGPLPLALTQFRAVIMGLVKFHVAIFVIMMLLPTPDDLTPSLNMKPSVWMLLLPLTLIGLLIQTSTEEMIFRGYLQSQLAARIAHPAVWILLPSLLFAVLHYSPESQQDSAMLIVLWAGAFGVVAADLTARSGTLGPAIALHLVNNTIAIALTAPEGNFDGLALFSYPFSLSDSAFLQQWMPVEMLVLLCTWLVARLALRC
jgi:membrane protease YdiL (CAAX protease family)